MKRLRFCNSRNCDLSKRLKTGLYNPTIINEAFLFYTFDIEL